MSPLINSPCKDCPFRYESCHSKCIKYLRYRSELDALNKRIHDEKYSPANLYMSDMLYKKNKKRKCLSRVRNIMRDDANR